MAHFAKRNTKFGGGKKLESESDSGQKFLPRRVAKRLLRGLPPNPLPFCPPERSVFCSAKGGAINRSFVQNRFELRSVIATIRFELCQNQNSTFETIQKLVKALGVSLDD